MIYGLFILQYKYADDMLLWLVAGIFAHSVDYKG